MLGAEYNKTSAESRARGRMLASRLSSGLRPRGRAPVGLPTSRLYRMKNRGPVSLSSILNFSCSVRQIPLQWRCCDRILGAGLITTRSEVHVLGVILPRVSARLVRARYASTDSSTADLLGRVFGMHRGFALTRYGSCGAQARFDELS